MKFLGIIASFILLFAISSTANSQNFDGDITQLSSYVVPENSVQEFELAAREASIRSLEKGTRFWLTYKETNIDSSSASKYFTIHIPRDLTELTDPHSAPIELITRMGHFRDHVELTRQVPAWCSTTALDPNLLEYAYVSYYWIKPGSFSDVSSALSKRGEIFREIFGTDSAGNAAMEGFVSMVAPFQVMTVLFSSESSQEEARRLFENDLQRSGKILEWNESTELLMQNVVKEESRIGVYEASFSTN